MNKGSPLAEVYLECVERHLKSPAEKVNVFITPKDAPKDSRVRAAYRPNRSSEIQIGRYCRTSFAYSEGIYGWGYPDFAAGDWLPSLSELCFFTRWFSSHLLPVKVTSTRQHEKDTIRLSEIDFTAKDESTGCRVKWKLGVLHIFAGYEEWQAKHIACLLEDMWEYWIQEIHTLGEEAYLKRLRETS